MARSRMDFRFGCKSSRAADITAMTEFGPEPDIGRIEILQRSSLLPIAEMCYPFCRKAREAIGL
jgi:hypothetical protein